MASSLRSSGATPGAARALNAVRRLVRAVHVAHHETERTVGISAAQLYVLQELAHAPRQSLNDLAARTMTHQSSISEVVRRLLTAGLVARRPAPDDRRRAELSLTPRGVALLREAPPTVQQKLIRGFGALSPARQRALVVSLEAWLQAAGLAEVAATMLFEPEARRGRAG